MEHLSINMGEIIREMRKSKALTQEALAQAMGVSIQAVSKWETGQSLPDVALLPSIADYFNIPVDALFGREAEPVQEEAAKPEEESAPSLFPDDDKLRVVQYLGNRLLSAEECTEGKEIRLSLDDLPNASLPRIKLEVEIQGSARISGPVNGALNISKDAWVSGDINGAANVQGDLTCKGNVNGSVRTGGSVNTHGTTTSIRMEGINEPLSGMKNSLSGLGSMISGMFGNRRTGNAAGAHMNAFFSGELPDDDVIRVVQLQGRRVMSAEESSGQRVIRLSVDHLTDPLNVEVYGSAQIEGDVHGNATAGDSMSCRNVLGHASAGDSLNCGNISGNASAGDGVRCGNVGGYVTAGDGVTCGTVGGSVRAGDSVHVTGDVGGNVTADDSVTCSVIHGSVKADSVKYTGAKRADGAETKKETAVSAKDMPDMKGFADGALHIVQVMNGKVLSDGEAFLSEPVFLCLEDATGVTLHVHGNAQIEGDVSGSVYANGSVTCENIEGDVNAGAQVNCETVEGNVRAGGQVSCENVEGDVQAGGQVTCADVEGDVSAGMSVTCADVSGNVTVTGSSDKCSVSCGGVEGNVSALNASVDCGVGSICGDVDARGEGNEKCAVSCGGIEGNVSALNASVDCGLGSICGDVDARGDQPERTIVICAGVEGNVTVLNASLNCREGSISGDVDVRGDQPDKCIVICEGVEGNVTLRNATLNCQNGSVGGDIDAQSDLFEE